MLRIDKGNIYLTRGDILNLDVSITDSEDNPYTFTTSDILVFSVKENYTDTTPLLRKNVTFDEETTVATIELTKEDTSIGDLINRPAKYVYDISLNGDQTVIGYDEKGKKLFVLYPEVSDDE